MTFGRLVLLTRPIDVWPTRLERLFLPIRTRVVVETTIFIRLFCTRPQLKRTFNSIDLLPDSLFIMRAFDSWSDSSYASWNRNRLFLPRTPYARSLFSVRAFYSWSDSSYASLNRATRDFFRGETLPSLPSAYSAFPYLAFWSMVQFNVLSIIMIFALNDYCES